MGASVRHFRRGCLGRTGDPRADGNRAIGTDRIVISVCAPGDRSFGNRTRIGNSRNRSACRDSALPPTLGRRACDLIYDSRSRSKGRLDRGRMVRRLSADCFRWGSKTLLRVSKYSRSVSASPHNSCQHRRRHSPHRSCGRRSVVRSIAAGDAAAENSRAHRPADIGSLSFRGIRHGDHRSHDFSISRATISRQNQSLAAAPRSRNRDSAVCHRDRVCDFPFIKDDCGSLILSLRRSARRCSPLVRQAR